jgi:predicted dehydrogenase
MDMIQVCIIGSSGHFGYVLDGLREVPEARLVGVAPGSPGETMDKVLAGASRLGAAPRLFDDCLDMLDELRPDVAAVACHFGDHARVAAEVLKRGIHAFVEKPVATTYSDLRMLRDVYAAGDARLAAMFGSRQMPHFRTARQAVREGAVGDIRLIQAQKSYRLGTRDAFYRQRSSYGGTIPWVGSHAIDWVRWIGGETFESVLAMHSTRDNKDHGELETTALCHFRMTNEVFASVSLDYLRPPTAPSHGDDRIRIAGTEGVLEVRDGRVLLMNGREPGIRELPLLPKEDLFPAFIRQLDEEDGRVSAEDAFAVTEACLKARQSADEGRQVLF